MRITVLQLARYGDIFQTWPVLSALKRKHPGSRLQLVVRQRYAEAAHLCPFVDQVIEVSTRDVLGPVLGDQNQVKASLEALDRTIQEIQGDEPINQLINLSFSPFSSYLVEELRSKETIVRGYSRHPDGFLNLVDDPSAYFYAQVGVGRSNRFHLIDLMAGVADVELSPVDFCAEAKNEAKLQNSDHELQPYIVIQMGASQSQKALPAQDVETFLRSFVKTRTEKVFLIGSAGEKIESDFIAHESRIVDLCGRTSLADLFPLVRGAQALISADSMSVQIANLTGTVTLNVSYSSVNFWETGPRAPGSRVLLFEVPEKTDPLRLRQEVVRLLTGEGPGDGVYEVVQGEAVVFRRKADGMTDPRAFQWSLIRAMYTGADYPITDRLDVALAFQRIHELSLLGLEQIGQLIKRPKDEIAKGILDEIDGLLQSTAGFCEEVRPLVNWFLTEKTRIKPGSFAKVAQDTRSVFEQLMTVTRLYSLRTDMNEQFPRKDLTWK